MPKTRIPSPARSQGGFTTPKAKRSRGSRSLCSPALSTASGRLTSLIEFRDKNMESFALSPLNGRSVLNDNTEIEEPKRKSWWKKLDENSQDVMEVLEDNKVTDVNNVIEEFIDIEVLSQEKKNYTLDLPESSDNESINSIVLPQRKLFTQKDNQPQKKFGQLIGNRESLAKLPKTNNTYNDKTVNAGTRELFQNAKRSKPLFPAALLNISPNKTTADKTKENIVPEPKPQIRSIFGNRPANKRKNIFADFIVSESEDEIPEIQPKVFGFQKKLEQRRISAVSKGTRDGSPTSSITTDMEMDDWKLLPSSTMVENQLEEMVAGHTPIKRAKLSKLSEAKESDVGTNTLQTNTTGDKTKQSNKSISSKNKSKSSLEVRDKSLNSSRTTRSMLKNASIVAENTNTSKTQDSKINKSQSRVSSNDIDISTSKSDEQNTTLNKSQKQNKSKLNSSKLIENEVESNEKVTVKAINNETRVISKSMAKILSSSTVSNKDKKETDTSKAQDKDKTSPTDIDQKEQEDDENNFSLQYENDDNEIMEEAATHNAQTTEHKDRKKRNTFVIQRDEQEIDKSKNKSTLNEKSIQKENKAAKTVEESVESQNEQYSADDNVDGNIEKQQNQNEKSKQEILEDIVENIDEENSSHAHNESQEKSHLDQVIENEEDENDGNEVDERGEIAVEADQSLEAEVDESQEVNDKVNESQEMEEDEDQENEDEEIEEEANKSEVKEANESQDNNEELNESQEEAYESQETEANKSQMEAEVDESNQSQEAEVDESEEQEEDANESQEVEEENESQEQEEEANESQENLEDSANEHEDEDADNSLANEASANESQEVENDDIESEAEANESEVDDDQEMDSDEADKAIASDPEISDQDGADEMEVDDDDDEQLSNQAQQDSDEQQNEIEQEIIEESPNVTHDTTGRHRRKDLKSPEAILHDKTNQMDSFTAKGRNTSVRKSKSMIKNLNIRPSLAPPRDSTGFSDGARNSSGEGSGWDSHRTTRKTLRQTFGKDFTPRKSLRALVMEKSAKRQTEHIEMHSETIKYPQANSTDLPEDSNRDFEDAVESDHEVSRRTRQTTLEMYLQKIKQQNIEKKIKMEEAVRNSLKMPVRDTLSLFKVPNKPAPRRPKPIQSKPKKQIKSIIPFDDLPSDVIQDMKYRPPKRFQPTNAAWITKRLYKFLENKLESKYDYKARIRAEKLVETIYHFAKDLRRHDVAPTDAVEVLKQELARLDVVNTHFEFYEFFHEFMPREIRVKVVPDIVNKIPLPRHGVFSDILRGNTVQG